MKENLVIKDFKYELYNKNNVNHLNFFNNLWNDNDTKKYLYDKDEFIDNIIYGDGKYNCIYLVHYNDNIIGFVSLYYFDGTYEISDGILDKYRRNGYSKKILSDFSNYIFENTNIDILYGYIDSSNYASIKSALSCGFIHTTNKEYILKVIK